MWDVCPSLHTRFNFIPRSLNLSKQSPMTVPLPKSRQERRVDSNVDIHIGFAFSYYQMLTAIKLLKVIYSCFFFFFLPWALPGKEHRCCHNWLVEEMLREICRCQASYFSGEEKKNTEIYSWLFLSKHEMNYHVGSKICYQISVATEENKQFTNIYNTFIFNHH